MSTVYTGRLEADKLNINAAELARRLHTTPDFRDDVVDRCHAELVKNSECKFDWIRVPVRKNGNRIDLGFVEFVSADLMKILPAVMKLLSSPSPWDFRAKGSS